MNQPLESLEYMTVFAVNQEKMHEKSSPGNIYAVGIMTPQISLNYYKVCQNNYAKHPTTHWCCSIFSIPNYLPLLPPTMFLWQISIDFCIGRNCFSSFLSEELPTFFSTSGK